MSSQVAISMQGVPPHKMYLYFSYTQLQLVLEYQSCKDSTFRILGSRPCSLLTCAGIRRSHHLGV